MSITLESFLDPTSASDDSSFYSFSSFAQLDLFSSPFASPYDGYASTPMVKEPSSQSINTDISSSISAASPLDQYHIMEAALEAGTNSGIFHTPIAGSSKLGRHSAHSSIDDSSMRSPASSISHWDDPLTPGLTVRGSVESLPSTMTISMHQAYAWDEAASSTLGASGPPSMPDFVTPHRTTSQPHLGNVQPRQPRTISSMPALREEDDMALINVGREEDYLPVIDEAICYSSRIGAVPQGTLSLEADAAAGFDITTRDFRGAFPGYGLGQTQVPTEDTIFAAFQQPYGHYTDASEQWSSTLGADRSAEFGPSFDSSSTINPRAVMGSSGEYDDGRSRPSTAPSQHSVSYSSQLSVPLDSVHRSMSSEGLVHARSAPARSLLSYAPQQFPHTPQSNPHFTVEPLPPHAGTPRMVPRVATTPTPITRRASHHGLSVQVSPGAYSPHLGMPATPQSGEFGGPSAGPIQMSRAGTMPIPTTRRLSTFEPSSLPESSHMAAHTHAQGQPPMPQPQAYHVPAQYAESSSPMRYHPPPQSWDVKAGHLSSHPFSTAPLVTVHPPPVDYAVQRDAPSTPHRVHPPPHPGPSPARRVIARMPSTPLRRKVSGSPMKSAGGKPRRVASQPAFGFINFTPNDAEKLLSGVAPSGSHAKRRRDDADPVTVSAQPDISDDRSRSKRSRSDE